MVWSTILIIIGSILTFLLLLLLFIILSPFYLGTKFSWADNKGQGYVSFWWVNPLVVYFKYDLATKAQKIIIAGWKIGEKKNAAEAPVSENIPPQESKAPVVAKYVPELPREEVKEREIEIPEEKPEVIEKEMPQEIYGPEVTAKTEEPVVEKPKKVEKKAEKKDNILTRLKKNRVLFFLRSRRWREKVTGWILRVFKSLFRIIRFDSLKLQVKAGLEDPSSVGAIYGIYEAVKFGLLDQNRKFDIRFEPVFMEDHLELRGETGIRSSIARLLVPFFVALFSFPYISTLILWRRSRKL